MAGFCKGTRLGKISCTDVSASHHDYNVEDDDCREHEGFSSGKQSRGEKAQKLGKHNQL